MAALRLGKQLQKSSQDLIRTFDVGIAFAHLVNPDIFLFTFVVDFNGESDLDLEYAMVLTNPQPVTLLQTGDLVEGAGFDNWLDAVDASFCTFEGMSYIEL